MVNAIQLQRAGKVQRTICDILAGKDPARCYISFSELTTGELQMELRARGMLAKSDKLGAFSVRRACFALARRGAIFGERVRDDETQRQTICWRLGAGPPLAPGRPQQSLSHALNLIIQAIRRADRRGCKRGVTPGDVQLMRQIFNEAEVILQRWGIASHHPG